MSAVFEANVFEIGTFDNPIYGGKTERINITDFEHLVVNENWSPAIQAAFDSVNTENGYTRGTTIFFPPGDYNIDKTLVFGENSAHWGAQLIGYGARLIGTLVLDQQVDDWATRAEAIEDEDLKLAMLEDDAAYAAAILELKTPPGFEGASFTIEGLEFDRVAQRVGVGIKVAADESPKDSTFINLKIFRQEVGIHINYAWQMQFAYCLLRSNKVGILGQNHFNNNNFYSCTFSRQEQHGLQIGPDQGSWGCTTAHISGCLFADNKGYGFWNRNGMQVTVEGCHFEKNANGLGNQTRHGNTTISTNWFHGVRPNLHGYTPYEGQGHVVLFRTQNVQLKNNRYGSGESLLVVGEPRFRCWFDTDPTVLPGAVIPDKTKVACDDGLSYYEYDITSHEFIKKSLIP